MKWAKRKIGLLIWAMARDTNDISSSSSSSSNISSNSGRCNNKRQKITAMTYTRTAKEQKNVFEIMLEAAKIPGVFEEILWRKRYHRPSTKSKELLSKLPLRLTIMHYLQPRDILNCIQTCKQWRNEIDNEIMWEELAKILSPNTVSVLEKLDYSSTLYPPQRQQPKLKYRSIALALANKEPRDDYDPPPKLQLKDIVIVVEFRNERTKKSMGAWCSDLSKLHTRISEPRQRWGCFQRINYSSSNNEDLFSSIVLSPNEIHDDVDDVNFECFALYAASERVEMSARLIRRDQEMNGKSVCLNDFGSVVLEDNNFGLEDDTFRFYTGDMSPTKLNSSGRIARDLCLYSGYNSVWFELTVTIKLVSDLEFKISSFDLELYVDMHCRTEITTLSLWITVFYF